MTPDADTCYRALSARDRRFDGVFFVGVRTTGVYCRPVCPARLPGRDRCDFFGRAAEAERAGFRACFRCRPELAPGLASVDAVPRLVRAAAARVEAGFLDAGSVDDLAQTLGVTARHLRRSMESSLGVSPVELAQSRRLALAKQLLQDTTMPLTQVAFASGFASVRRFNALFQARFGRAPSGVRRQHGTGASDGMIPLRLDYRPPLDTVAMFAFLGARAIPGVERGEDGGLQRTVRIGDTVGWVSVSPDGERPALRARVSLSLAPRLAEVVVRLRRLFDLDAQPTVIAETLRRDARLAPLVALRPGLRVPGAFDGFETAVRTVLGQQVSVRAATTIAGRVARAFGPPAPAGLPGLDVFFPSAAELADVPIDRLRAIGLTGARAATLQGLARAVVRGDVILDPSADHGAVMEALVAIPGIGPWTAHAIAMRVLRWPDAFPASDLAVLAILGTKSAREAEALSAAWRPWRAYAVLHLWTSHAVSSKGG